MCLPLTTAIIEDAPKMQANHLKEHLSTRGLPESGAKYTLVEHLSKALNDISVMIDLSKIVVTMPIEKSLQQFRNQ